MAEVVNEGVLREAENNVTIEGILSENKLEQKTIDGKTMIMGTLEIETEEGVVHSVKMFSTQLKSDGTPNKIFETLATIMNQYKSIAKFGRDNADKVRVGGAKLDLEDYYANDVLKNTVKVKGNFAHRLKPSQTFNPGATFEVEAFIHSIIDEEKNETPTGRLIIRAIVPMYKGKAAPMEFIVEDEEVINGIKTYYNAGDTVTLYGSMIFKTTQVQKQAKVAFGKAPENNRTNTVRELLVTSGSEPYDEEKKYSIKAIKKAMTERELYLTELKEKSKQQQTKTSNGIVTSTSASATDEELPF